MLQSLRYIPKNYFGFVSSLFNKGGSNQPIPKDILINAETANQLIKNTNVKFLDVRDPVSFSKGHIPGALTAYEIYKYLAKTDEKGITDFKNTFIELFQSLGITGEEHIVAYEECGKSRYGASCRAYFILKLLGHPSVSIINGGWEVWQQQNFPIDSSIKKSRRNIFKAGWNSSMISTVNDVLQALEKKDTVILDVRDHIEWMGSTSSPFGINFVPRKGRIPGAVWIPWYDFLDIKEDGTQFFLQPDEIKKKLLAKNITPDQKVITYCFKGTRSANSYIALKLAGYDKVSNYQGSWNEWARDSDLPIDKHKIRD